MYSKNNKHEILNYIKIKLYVKFKDISNSVSTKSGHGNKIGNGSILDRRFRSNRFNILLRE